MYILKATDDHGCSCDDYVFSIQEARMLAACWVGWGYTNVRLVNDMHDLIERYPLV